MQVRKIRFLNVVACFLATVCVVGCRSVGYKKGDATAISMRDATRDVRHESRALDVVMERLDNLVSHPATDLKPQFKGFDQALDHLIASAERADKAARRIDRESREYFEVWDKELARMNYGIIRDRSEARKTAVSNQVNTVFVRYQETQAVMQPVISYFEDIRKALGADLTVEGLEVVRDVASRSSENTRKLQMALDALTRELVASSSRLSSFAIVTPDPKDATQGDTTGVSQARAAQ